MQEDENFTESNNKLVDDQESVQENPELLNEKPMEAPEEMVVKVEIDKNKKDQIQPSDGEINLPEGEETKSNSVDEPEAKQDSTLLASEENLETKDSNKNLSDESADLESNDERSNDSNAAAADKDEDPFESINLEQADKPEIVDFLKKFSNSEDMRMLDKALKETKPLFDKIYAAEKENALEEYLKEPGVDKADFQYKGDEVDANFFLTYNTLRDKKQKYYSQLSRDKESNLKRKNEILDEIRNLVDGEETNASIDQIKGLQSEWKSIGQVPGQHAKTLWANYNALLDRFYDNRSIYFELKELDRKKNLQAKLELCEKANDLNSETNIKKAIFQLNELHDEFKHIGPVPKEEQDPLWDKFKAASDQIYLKRKDFYEELKTKQSENVKVKIEIGNEAEELAKFDSDKISDWNKKTKQVLELQKKWEAAGGIPKEQSKEVNKHFWSNFKKFFANKNSFFKKLDSERQGNLEKKKELLEKAEELKKSTDWDKTANELKNLQNEWREIGPVPEKFRNQVYEKFKAACDAFFESKRSDSSGQGVEFLENLKKKEEICSMLEAYLNTEDIALDEVYGLIDRYSEVGFVPKGSIDTIHKRFDGIIGKLLSFEELTDAQRTEIEIKIEVNKLKNSPHGAQKLNRKESSIRRKINELENEIGTFQTNMDFFAASKNADKLKEELKEKMVKAEQEIIELRRQLKVFKGL